MCSPPEQGMPLAYSQHAGDGHSEPSQLDYMSDEFRIFHFKVTRGGEYSLVPVQLSLSNDAPATSSTYLGMASAYGVGVWVGRGLLVPDLPLPR